MRKVIVSGDKHPVLMAGVRLGKGMRSDNNQTR
nr:MAG TPA: hypothetical protein [Caudoviricetes sp.]